MKRRIIFLSIISLVILLLIPIVVSAAKTLIMYNPKNGKPVIVAGEEIPEELMGQEVSVMVPQKVEPVSEEPIGNVTEEINVVSQKRSISNSEQEIEAQIEAYKDLEENFDEIMYKYHGTEKINQVHTAMNNENPATDVITSYTFPESGKTLLRYVVEIFDTMNPTEEEKQVLREFSQMMVSGNDINDEELENRINSL